MISLEDRQNIAAMIEQARREGARLKAACEVGGINARTLQRWETTQVCKMATPGRERSAPCQPMR